MKTIFILLLLISCNKKSEEQVFDDLEKEYLDSLPLEGKVFMNACLRGDRSWMQSCIRDYRESGNKQIIKIQ